MNRFTKYFLLFSMILGISIFSGLNAYAQENQTSGTVKSATIDSLKTVISKLEKSIEQGSYTRIPNEDFENIIDNKIDNSFRETIKWWLFIIAAIVSLIGFLVNKYAAQYLQTLVDSKVNNLKEGNEEKIKEISNHYFSSVIETLLDFKTEKIAKLNNIVDETIVDDLKTYLKEESFYISKSKKVALIDTIMLCYYLNDYDNKIEKMIDLIREFEGKFTLMETTYANASIAFSGMYNRYGTREYLVSAVENCNKSIKIKPYYGLAFAQKLELYMMAISKAFDDTEKQAYELELRKVFKDIENNTSTYLCYDIINRFEADKTSYMGPFLDKLYEDYLEDMAKITSRSDAIGKQDEEQTDTQV